MFFCFKIILHVPFFTLVLFSDIRTCIGFQVIKPKFRNSMYLYVQQVHVPLHMIDLWGLEDKKKSLHSICSDVEFSN